MQSLPSLPPISGDLMLKVFTHRSLCAGIVEPTNDEYGGNDRLTVLGASVLDMVITWCLFSQKPMLKASDIVKQREDFWSDENLANLVTSYGLIDKLRRDPALPVESVQNVEEYRFLLNTYIGAVHVEYGSSPVQEWINRLLNPDARPVPQTSPSRPTFAHNSLSFGSPQPPSSPPPPLPPTNYAGLPSAGSLARLNELASRSRLLITWDATSVGPPHQPTWSIICRINGIEAGKGVGKNQKAAKEDAAAQAIDQLIRDPTQFAAARV